MRRKVKNIYRFSKFKNLIIWLIPIITFLIMAEIMFFDSSNRYYGRMLAGAFGIIGYAYLLYNNEYSEKYVEFYESYVRLNSFKNNNIVRSYNVPYESIRELKAVYIPIIGIYKVVIYADNIPRSITVYNSIERYNEMFCKLYSKSIEYNPRVNVSKNLARFAKRRKNEE